ncbi:WD40 repeat-like protein [Sistotremastrum suecicum HHB10207 ss-3]|uniref:WD40 repeat-like protein n=1 Tax=Sistotremastrum suecicum HHB10207 ss-3 TaxID=1314776 RepID=A0A166D435_9AGAM|nr:WD40 repeat-like protein [Sistotremastrum suecicum HHB10207 ss-3]
MSHLSPVWAASYTSASLQNSPNTPSSVFASTATGHLTQFDSTTGAKLRGLNQHTLAIVSLSTNRVGSRCLFNSLEGVTGIWEVPEGGGPNESEAATEENVTRYESFKGKNQTAWSVSLHPSGETYASSGQSGNVHIHSAKTALSHSSQYDSSTPFGTPLSTLDSGRARFGMFVKHSPDGQRIAMSSESGTIYLFDLTSSTLLTTYSSHAMCVRSLAWSPDSQLLLSASDDKRLVLHDVRSTTSGKPGSAVAYLTGHSSWVLSNDISPDQRLVVSGSADKTVKIWDLAQRSCVSTAQDTGDVWSVAWKPTIPSPGQGAGSFISAGEDGLVKWWRSAGSA